MIFIDKQMSKERKKATTDYRLEKSPWASVWNGTFVPLSITTQCKIIRRCFVGFGWG
jgi:hypothetical protein